MLNQIQINKYLGANFHRKFFNNALFVYLVFAINHRYRLFLYFIFYYKVTVKGKDKYIDWYWGNLSVGIIISQFVGKVLMHCWWIYLILQGKNSGQWFLDFIYVPFPISNSSLHNLFRYR